MVVTFPRVDVTSGRFRVDEAPVFFDVTSFPALGDNDAVTEARWRVRRSAVVVTDVDAREDLRAVVADVTVAPPRELDCFTDCCCCCVDSLEDWAVKYYNKTRNIAIV